MGWYADAYEAASGPKTQPSPVSASLIDQFAGALANVEWASIELLAVSEASAPPTWFSVAVSRVVATLEAPGLQHLIEQHGDWPTCNAFKGLRIIRELCGRGPNARQASYLMGILRKVIGVLQGELGILRTASAPIKKVALVDNCLWVDGQRYPHPIGRRNVLGLLKRILGDHPDGVLFSDEHHGTQAASYLIKSFPSLFEKRAEEDRRKSIGLAPNCEIDPQHHEL